MFGPALVGRSASGDANLTGALIFLSILLFNSDCKPVQIPHDDYVLDLVLRSAFPCVLGFSKRTRPLVPDGWAVNLRSVA